MRGGFQLIVFDWDGTLMDSEARIVQCVQRAARDVGIAEPSDAEARDIIGLGLAEALARLFPGQSPQRLEALVEAYRHHWLGPGLAESPLFEGAEALVRELGAKYLLGVATGKSRRGLDRAFDETGLRECFHATRCADEAHSKPHPQMLLDVMDRLGVEPARTLMVGDTEYDMAMARSAGVTGLGVSYGVHDPGRLAATGAVDCINDIRELRDWLKGG